MKAQGPPVEAPFEGHLGREIGPEVGPIDAVVIGSGFGGAVCACRLTEAGLRVLLLERGRRYDAADFPRLDLSGEALPDLARWRWGADQGIYDVQDLGALQVGLAAGYGGGSLIYANVHLRAPADVLDGWPEHSRAALDPYYDEVARMLGVAPLIDDLFSPPLAKSAGFEAAAQALGREVFSPPVAIWQGPPGPNAQGRQQGPCVGCGECDIGCPHRAKNTLDYNYLARAEDSGRLVVRTLSEVRLLESTEAGYRLHLRNHLFAGRRERLTAPRIFLCAGSVGSTELLLRSQARGLLSGLSPTLGSRYAANADSFALVTQTRDKLAPSRGPTITRGLRHQRQAGADLQQLLLQEGGFPPSMRRLFGLFGSAALLGRNAFDPVDGADLTPAQPPSNSDEIARLLSRVEWPEDALQAAIPSDVLRLLAHMFATLEGTALSELNALTDGVLDRVMPALRHDRVQAFQSSLAKVPLIGGVGWIQRIAAWLATRLSRVIEGQIDPKVVAEQTAAAFEARALGAPGARSPVDVAARIGQLLIDHLAPALDDHTLMLLAMGRDLDAGRLFLETKPGRSPRLRALLPQDRATAMHAESERLMRDVAGALGGTLRTWPGWALSRRSITVHSQGGCPMGRSIDEGVVDPWGEVFGQKDLFVVDAAIFPSSVGVNPSSSIAALAERIVEHQIRRILGQSAWQRGTNTAPLAGGLDPLPGLSTATPAPSSKPVGLTFAEVLRGFHHSGPTALEDPFEIAASRGREDQTVLTLRLQVTIDDLDTFLIDPARRARVEGAMDVRWRPGEPVVTLPVHGELELLGALANGARSMIYTLDFEGGRLTGDKVLDDDLGADAWADATTVAAQITLPEAGRSLGVLRVHLADFLNTQLPSIQVTGLGQGPGNDGQRAWALARFARFFFSEIQRVYLPQSIAGVLGL